MSQAGRGQSRGGILKLWAVRGHGKGPEPMEQALKVKEKKWQVTECSQNKQQTKPKKQSQVHFCVGMEHTAWNKKRRNEACQNERLPIRQMENKVMAKAKHRGGQ